MNTIDRITQLEANQIALLYVLRALLPLISADPADVSRLLTTAHDALTTHMEKSGDGPEFQRAARASFDALAQMLR